MIEKNNNEQTKEKRRALFSDCMSYRYLLQIEWDPELPRIQFIGLNPSTADEMKDDRTITRIKRFSRDWGYGCVMMTNLFAFRATDPKMMKAHTQPIGESKGSYITVCGTEFSNANDFQIHDTRMRCETAVACWGNHGTHLYRATKVKQFLKNLSCFRITENGQPEHPLYLSAEMKPIPLPV